MTTDSTADVIDGTIITADPAEPYVAQLARQLQAFASITDVDDLAPDDVGDLLLVLANAAERLETEASHIALLAQRKGVGKHLGSSSTGAWLAHRTRLTPGHAHRMIRRSETEHAFGLFYLAHADGKVTGYHRVPFGHPELLAGALNVAPAQVRTN